MRGGAGGPGVGASGNRGGGYANRDNSYDSYYDGNFILTCNEQLFQNCP